MEVPNLTELNLNKNHFMSLEQDAFKDLKDLNSLDLSQNQLEDVNGLFSHQSSLVWLNLSANHLLWFDYAFIPPSLEYLDIHFNNIDSLGMISHKKSLTTIFGLKHQKFHKKI